MRRDVEKKTPRTAKVTTFLIIAAAGAIVAMAATYWWLDPVRIAHRELEFLAKDYYEHYFYDKLADGKSDQAKREIFSLYEETGFPIVYLRQLLLFDNARHADSRKYFEGRYTCNTNETNVRIVPHKPYGKTDYKVEYYLSCKDD